MAVVWTASKSVVLWQSSSQPNNQLIAAVSLALPLSCTYMTVASSRGDIDQTSWSRSRWIYLALFVTELCSKYIQHVRMSSGAIILSYCILDPVLTAWSWRGKFGTDISFLFRSSIARLWASECVCHCVCHCVWVCACVCVCVCVCVCECVRVCVCGHALCITAWCLCLVLFLIEGTQNFWIIHIIASCSPPAKLDTA